MSSWRCIASKNVLFGFPVQRECRAPCTRHSFPGVICEPRFEGKGFGSFLKHQLWMRRERGKDWRDPLHISPSS